MTLEAIAKQVVTSTDLGSPTISKLISWSIFPNKSVFTFPHIQTYPIPEYPLHHKTETLQKLYENSVHWAVPLVFGLTYFFTVQQLNKIILKRQIRLHKSRNPYSKELPSSKRLPPAPTSLSKTSIFKFLVILHNLFLCIYSTWTFIGLTSSLYINSNKTIPKLVESYLGETAADLKTSGFDYFWYSVSDQKHGIWYNGLSYYAYYFYLSKFYEIIDTLVILLKGRPSSLLQSYHHSGAILCMWTGVRFSSSTIWIFVVFNSFIHSIMYFYYTLSCLKIKVHVVFKQTLTTLQIIQFLVGGSLAIVHLFVSYFDVTVSDFVNCIPSSEKALCVFINVSYLTPLTMLFASFYIDSYRNKGVKKQSPKKDN